VNSYTAEVRITPREGLLDPEGKAVQSALRSLEFEDVEDVRVGRLVRLKLQAQDAAAAQRSAETMCRKLLANPVTEDFDIVVSNGDGSAGGR
jgi:phosphoribosylformylglycinamidine synthase subunit PurS